MSPEGYTYTEKGAVLLRLQRREVRVWTLFVGTAHIGQVFSSRRAALDQARRYLEGRWWVETISARLGPYRTLTEARKVAEDLKDNDAMLRDVP